MHPDPGRPGAPLPAQSAPVPAAPSAPRRRGGPRPTPVVDAAYAHLGLDALRDYRRALTEEEDKVSYWRRILQARLDVVETGADSRGVERERLAPVLTSERVGQGRRALVEVVQVDDIPPLPSLGELWDRSVDPADTAGRRLLLGDLRAAESQLSAYRAALHTRIADATGELIARYRHQPALCLTALPLPSQRAASGAVPTQRTADDDAGSAAGRG